MLITRKEFFATLFSLPFVNKVKVTRRIPPDYQFTNLTSIYYNKRSLDCLKRKFEFYKNFNNI